MSVDLKAARERIMDEIWSVYDTGGCAEAERELDALIAEVERLRERVDALEKETRLAWRIADTAKAELVMRRKGAADRMNAGKWPVTAGEGRMSDQACLAVGMYLGTHCRIAKMERFKYGWRMTDTTGAVYKSTDFPNGLRATVCIEPNVEKRPYVQWPV